MLTFTSRLPRAAVTGATLVATLAGAVALAGVAVPAAHADQIRDSQQWVLSMLDVPTAWQTSQGAGVTVAVIDSGVNPDVSDLSGSVVTGPNLTGLSTPPSNADWGVHGTWMASVIAGHGHNGGADGITGIAPQARVLSIRVIPDKGDPGYHAYDAEKEQAIQQSLATGIMTATKDGARVISMSIGYSAPSSAVRAALQYAESHGVVLVASSGNSGQDLSPHSGFAPVSFPAEYPGVLSVAAVNQAGAVASFSSNNLSVKVAAPGVDVPAEGRDGQYWLVSGTSPACALVAGVAALIKSKYPGLAPQLVDQALTSSARSGQGISYNAKTGFGTVDAAAALRAAGQLATQHSGKSPEAASARFGGGPAAVPASPVQPRGAGQLVLFSLLGLVGLILMVGGGWRLRPSPPPAAGMPVGYGPVDYGPVGYGAPGGYPGHPGYLGQSGYPGQPGGQGPGGYPTYGGGYPSSQQYPGSQRYPGSQYPPQPPQYPPQ